MLNLKHFSTVLWRVFSSLTMVILLVFVLAVPNAMASHAPESARAYLIEPANGQTVSAEFTAKFGLSGMGIAPAGVEREGTGHHHLLIDLPELPDLTQALPANDNVKHFGKGQTEAALNLTPGQHTLQLVLGDYTHVPHDHPVISDKITIMVK